MSAAMSGYAAIRSSFQFIRPKAAAFGQHQSLGTSMKPITRCIVQLVRLVESNSLFFLDRSIDFLRNHYAEEEQEQAHAQEYVCPNNPIYVRWWVAVKIVYE